MASYRRWVVLGAAALTLLVSSRDPIAAQEKRFEPEKHFPGRSLVWLSTGDLDDLGRRFTETLAGRIVHHPGMGRALEPLWSRLETNPLDAELEPMLGVGFQGLLELFEGGVSISFASMLPTGAPELIVAIDRADNVESWNGVIERLRGHYRNGTGSDVETVEIGGEKVRVWRTPELSIYECVLGTHLILATTPDLVRDVQSLYRGTSSATPIGESAFLREVSEGLGTSRRDVTFAVNVQALSALLMPFVLQGGANSEEIREMLRLTGIDRVTSLGFSVGIENGVTEVGGFLGTREGMRGLLEALLAGTRGLESPDAFLARVPEGAYGIAASRFAVGTLLEEVYRRVVEQLPEMRDSIDSFFTQIESASGIDVRKDIFTLGEIAAWSYVIEPPAGSLLGDWITLVKTDELEPYWKLFTKIIALAGIRERSLEESPRPIRYFDFGGSAAGSRLLERLMSGEPTEEELVPLTISFFLSSFAFARSDLDGGWSVISQRPQSLWRFHGFYSKAKTIASDAEPARAFREAANGAWSAGAFRLSEWILACYNTLVDVSSLFSAQLGLLGVRVAELPPAEVFLANAHTDVFRMSASSKGFGFRARSELLPFLTVAGAALMQAGWWIESLDRGF